MSKWPGERVNKFKRKKYKWPINAWKTFSYQRNRNKKDIEIPFHPLVRMSIIKHKNKQANKQTNK